MKITKKGEYALRALIVLASAFENKETLTLRQISERDELPFKFLEQIMIGLKGAKLVQSMKGKHGGYALSRNPKEITLGEIIRVVDGPLAPILSAEEMEHRIETDGKHAGLYSILLDVRNAISKILDKRTLADILEITLERASAKRGTQMYYI